MSQLPSKSAATELLEALEMFQNRFGDYTTPLFFFGVALGAMNSKINSEEIMAAIEKLTAAQQEKGA